MLVVTGETTPVVDELDKVVVVYVQFEKLVEVGLKLVVLLLVNMPLMVVVSPAEVLV